MNDNEIIKSAEHCINSGSCADCLYDTQKGGCRGLTASLVSIINRQKAEIEEKSNKLREILPIVAELKAEALKEFTERIQSHIRQEDVYPYVDIVEVEGIDIVVKELCGKEDEGI